MKPHLHVYNRNERGGPWWKTAQWSLGATIRGTYHGTLLKGWWQLGRSSINRRFEIELALGGEDNMAQVGLVVPFAFRWHIGVRVPRRLTGWIYHRREWTLRIGYAGRWLELLIASDEHMRDTGMVDYYRRKRENPDCANCKHYAAFHSDPVLVRPSSVKSLDDVDKLTTRIPNPGRRCITQNESVHGLPACSCPGYVPAKLPWTRVALWPGWHLTLAPEPLDWIFGRKDCVTTKGEPEPVIVPMPEGNYPGMARQETRVWKRKRWPWPSMVRSGWWIDMQVGVPTPGKGENSWDIDDDAIYGTGGSTRAEAIANVTAAALRQRERYAGDGWTPDKGWPEEIAA